MIILVDVDQFLNVLCMRFDIYTLFNKNQLTFGVSYLFLPMELFNMVHLKYVKISLERKIVYMFNNIPRRKRINWRNLEVKQENGYFYENMLANYVCGGLLHNPFW